MKEVLDSVFTSVFQTSAELTGGVTSGDFLVCCVASLMLGCLCALTYMFKHDYSKNFVVTLALMPLIVQMVITLVNGNIGAGIAVMGVFNLVRFRSIPGSAKDIGSVFFAMAIGLATGMGYLALAALFTFIVGIANIVYVLSPFGKKKEPGKLLKVMIPEDLDYTGIFDDLFEQYASSYELVEVRTTNMGSLFQLDYQISLKDASEEKSLIDAIRCRNGNLKVSCGRIVATRDVL